MVSLGELEVNLPFQTLDFGGNATSDVHSYLGSDSQGEFKYNLQIEIQAGYRISIKILPLRGRNTDGLIRTFVKEAIKVSSSANVDTTVSSTNQPGSGQFPAQPGYQRPNPAIFPGIGNPQGDYSSPIAIPPKKKKKLRRPSETVTSGAVARSSTDSWHDDPEIQHSDHREPKDPTNTDVDAIVKEENTAMFSEDTATDTKDGDSMDGDTHSLNEDEDGDKLSIVDVRGSQASTGGGMTSPILFGTQQGHALPNIQEMYKHIGLQSSQLQSAPPEKFKTAAQRKTIPRRSSGPPDLISVLTIPADLETNTCVQCGKAYTGKSGLLAHLKLKHGMGKQHICPICFGRVSSKENLEGHMNTRHFHTKPHKCLKCGEGFAFASYCRRHQQKCNRDNTK